MLEAEIPESEDDGEDGDRERIATTTLRPQYPGNEDAADEDQGVGRDPQPGDVHARSGRPLERRQQVRLVLHG